ncbi:MAG: hypothetical protein U5J99_14340 [Parvularculaceae bacterium]|nr:hypothetical protein [Parvularculaceae bacterium]
MISYPKKIAAALLGAGLVLGAAPAFAGEWRLDRSRCPDLGEDRRDARESRRDERYDYSRRDVREDRYDRRESRRDRAVTVCPRSAFYYAPDRHERRRADFRAPRLRLSYDRDYRMNYRYDDGVRIYLRG